MISVDNGRLGLISIGTFVDCEAGIVERRGETHAAFRADLAQIRGINEARLDGEAYRVISAERVVVKGPPIVRLTLAKE